MIDKNFLLRGARNTLLDMLLEPIGATYPLSDLSVNPVVDIVPYDDTAEIMVSAVQPDVSYQLYDALDNLSKPKVADRNGLIVFKTAPLTGKVHVFKVKATKILYPESNKKGKAKAAKIPLTTILYHVANVRIGINPGLEVWCENNTIHYCEKISLTIKNAQEGAYYSIIYCPKGSASESIDQLIDLNGAPVPERIAVERSEDGKVRIPEHILLSQKLLGDNADLHLTTSYGFLEDLELRIAVFDKDTGLSGMLAAVTEINVRPNLDITPTWVSGKPSIEVNRTGAAKYGSVVSIRLKGAQLSTQYRIKLDQWDSEESAPTDDGFLSGWTRGSNGTVDIAMDSKVTEDLIVTIEARKIDNKLKGKIPSKLFIPVLPNASNIVKVDNRLSTTSGKTIKVFSPQRGIIYQLQNAKTEALIFPSVFYNRNLGIGSVRIGQQFVATNYKEGDSLNNLELIKSLFAVGLMEDEEFIKLPTGPLSGQETFKVIATKSTTGFSTVVKTITVKG